MNPSLQNSLPGSPLTRGKAIKINGWVSVALLALLLICYANSLQATWHYDDFPNIVENAKVRMTELSWAQIKKGLSAGWNHQTISRPLAYLSFALNYRWGGYKVRGYHIVNFTIHWLASIFLFLFIQRLLSLPLLQGCSNSKATVVAGLAAAFWATHPIQVTAVTYIVQRMTAMAGLFYIASLYFYLVGRTSDRNRIRGPAFVACALSAAAAMLTKENSVLLIYAFFLLDWLFLKQAHSRNRIHAFIWILGLTAAIGLLGLLYADPRGLLKPFSNRPFSMVQRLMSQPRMLFDYLGMLAVPMTSRLALVHDVTVSRSLWVPWTTVPAMAGLIAVIVGLFLLIRKHPLLAFCGLFFFLNHLVESSFLNLELFYEHRNYIPSMLLFVPVAIAAVKSMDYFKYRRSFQYMIGATLLLLLAANMQTTLAYNHYMKSELSLWSHVVECYPRSSLGHSNLGKAYWTLGLFEASCREHHTAIDLDRFNEQHQKGLAYYNLGLCEAYKQRNFILAMKYFKRSQALYDDYPLVAHEIARCWIQLGKWSSASEVLDAALVRWPDNPELLDLQAIIELKKGHYPAAVQEAREVIRIQPSDQMAWMVMAEGFRRMGKVQKSLESWQKLSGMYPDNIIAVLALMQIHVEQGQLDEACRYVGRYLELKKYRFSLEAIEFSRQNRRIVPYAPNDQLLKKVLNANCFNSKGR